MSTSNRYAILQTIEKSFENKGQFLKILEQVLNEKPEDIFFFLEKANSYDLFGETTIVEYLIKYNQKELLLSLLAKLSNIQKNKILNPSNVTKIMRKWGSSFFQEFLESLAKVLRDNSDPEEIKAVHEMMFSILKTSADRNETDIIKYLSEKIEINEHNKKLFSEQHLITLLDSFRVTSNNLISTLCDKLIDNIDPKYITLKSIKIPFKAYIGWEKDADTNYNFVKKLLEKSSPSQKIITDEMLLDFMNVTNLRPEKIIKMVDLLYEHSAIKLTSKTVANMNSLSKNNPAVNHILDTLFSRMDAKNLSQEEVYQVFTKEFIIATFNNDAYAINRKVVDYLTYGKYKHYFLDTISDILIDAIERDNSYKFDTILRFLPPSTTLPKNIYLAAFTSKVPSIFSKLFADLDAKTAAELLPEILKEYNLASFPMLAENFAILKRMQAKYNIPALNKFIVNKTIIDTIMSGAQVTESMIPSEPDLIARETFLAAFESANPKTFRTVLSHLDKKSLTELMQDAKTMHPTPENINFLISLSKEKNLPDLMSFVESVIVKKTARTILDTDSALRSFSPLTSKVEFQQETSNSAVLDAQNREHYKKVIEPDPILTEEYNKREGDLFNPELRFKNFEKEYRKTVLTAIEEYITENIPISTAKTKLSDVESERLKKMQETQKFINENREKLIAGDSATLKIAREKHFNSVRVVNHIAWRCFDPEAPVRKAAWPNLLVRSGNTELRKMLAYYYLSTVGSKERTQDFIAYTAATFRGHNIDENGKEDYGDDEPNCDRGCVTRLSNIMNKHPTLARVKDIKEIVQQKMTAIIFKKFNEEMKRLKDTYKTLKDINAAQQKLADGILLINEKNAKSFIDKNERLKPDEDFTPAQALELIKIRNDFINNLGSVGSIRAEVNQYLAENGIQHELTDEEVIYLRSAINNPGGDFLANPLTTLATSYLGSDTSPFPKNDMQNYRNYQINLEKYYLYDHLLPFFKQHFENEPVTMGDVYDFTKTFVENIVSNREMPLEERLEKALEQMHKIQLDTDKIAPDQMKLHAKLANIIAQKEISSQLSNTCAEALSKVVPELHQHPFPLIKRAGKVSQVNLEKHYAYQELYPNMQKVLEDTQFGASKEFMKEFIASMIVDFDKFNPKERIEAALQQFTDKYNSLASNVKTEKNALEQAKTVMEMANLFLKDEALNAMTISLCKALATVNEKLNPPTNEIPASANSGLTLSFNQKKADMGKTPTVTPTPAADSNKLTRGPV